MAAAPREREAEVRHVGIPCGECSLLFFILEFQDEPYPEMRAVLEPYQIGFVREDDLPVEDALMVRIADVTVGRYGDDEPSTRPNE